jgi:transposase
MADIISFGQRASARRRAREQAATEACVHILEANLQLALHVFAVAPDAERPLRARQLRQLAELLEYVTRCA